VTAGRGMQTSVRTSKLVLGLPARLTVVRRFFAVALALAATAAGCGHSNAGQVSVYRDPSIRAPHSITAGPDGALWFTNTNGNSIGRISTDGTVTNYSGATIKAPHSITTGPDGALWFTNTNGNSIGRITTLGKVMSYKNRMIWEPTGIAKAADGSLWFGNLTRDTDDPLSPKPGYLGAMKATGAVQAWRGDPRLAGPEEPEELVAGPDGAIWSIWWNGEGLTYIERTTKDGVNHDDYQNDSILNNSTYCTSGITAGPDKAVWFTTGSIGGCDVAREYGQPDLLPPVSIGRIDASGSVRRYRDPLIVNPGAITVGPDDALWFVNGAHAIGRITTDGHVRVYTDPRIKHPTAITTGADGALWFTNSTGHSIGRITS
jgi:virginiamycin B lyase